ncbi:MAG: hypothetical protein U1A27_01595 [Phycisphaerae bacterium]
MNAATRFSIRPPRLVAPRRRRAFSLQEVLISVGVLGVGLVLVAAVFPAALFEHRVGVEGATALSLARRADALMGGKITPAVLWRPASTGVMPAGEDGPWSVLPALNLIPNELLAAPPPGPGQWFIPAVTLTVPAGVAPAYGNYINTLAWPVAFGSPAWVDNPLALGAADIISDVRLPPDDLVAEEASFRLVWTGFYRELASGAIEHAAALCRQVRGETYAAQALPTDTTAAATPFLMPLVDPALPVRMPLPWRVTVAHVPGTQVLTNDPAGSGPAWVPLSSLAPLGAKFILTGLVNGAAPLPVVPSGRVLTVSDVNVVVTGLANDIRCNVQVVEDLSDIESSHSFDLWIFPPTYTAAGFGKRSPVVDWVFF